jgi:hypothetical protein
MIAVRGRIQREGDVVHLVAQRLTDLSAGSVTARCHSRYRTDGAISSVTAAQDLIRATFLCEGQTAASMILMAALIISE